MAIRRQVEENRLRGRGKYYKSINQSDESNK